MLGGMPPSSLTLAWRANCRATLELFESIPPEGLEVRYSPRTRTVAAQFIHIHYVRVKNLEERGPPGGGHVAALDPKADPSTREIVHALRRSGRAMEAVFEDCAASGRVRRWSGPPETYLGYHCAHEAHHRGLVLVSLRLAGVRLPQGVRYGLWSLWRKDPWAG